jgi:DNA-directed RNA polymerase specialized sigma24 family protein
MPRNAAETGLDDWQDVMQRGDEEAFQHLVAPYFDTLLKAARHDLDFYVAQGHLQDDDYTPEEVVGETQLYAWRHRMHCPEKMSLRGWLLGVQHRLLRHLVEQQRSYREDKAIELDAPIPISADDQDKEEQFWEWYQPEDETLWEDVLPAVTPVDIEIDLDKEGRDAILAGDETARHVLIMHDEFEMTLPEIAFTLEQSINDVARTLETVRANFRERMQTRLERRSEIEEDDQPAPPEGSDE